MRPLRSRSMRQWPPPPWLTILFLRPNCPHPVKQKRALLKSNPPSDIRMRRRNKTSPFLGRPKPPQIPFRQTFISEPPHASKKLTSTTFGRQAAVETTRETRRSGPEFTRKFCYRPILSLKTCRDYRRYPMLEVGEDPIDLHWEQL